MLVDTFTKGRNAGVDVLIDILKAAFAKYDIKHIGGAVRVLDGVNGPLAPWVAAVFFSDTTRIIAFQCGAPLTPADSIPYGSSFLPDSYKGILEPEKAWENVVGLAEAVSLRAEHRNMILDVDRYVLRRCPAPIARFEVDDDGVVTLCVQAGDPPWKGGDVVRLVLDGAEAFPKTEQADLEVALTVRFRPKTLASMISEGAQRTEFLFRGDAKVPIEVLPCILGSNDKKNLPYRGLVMGVYP